ncbi:hypothetical protein ACRAWF_22080 [Streptomyces sp. L7]
MRPFVTGQFRIVGDLGQRGLGHGVLVLDFKNEFDTKAYKT